MSFAEASDQHASYFLPGPSMLVFVFVSGDSFSAFGCAKTSDFRHALAPYILRTPQGPLIFASTVASKAVKAKPVRKELCTKRRFIRDSINH